MYIMNDQPRSWTSAPLPQCIITTLPCNTACDRAIVRSYHSQRCSSSIKPQHFSKVARTNDDRGSLLHRRAQIDLGEIISVLASLNTSTDDHERIHCSCSVVFDTGSRDSVKAVPS